MLAIGSYPVLLRSKSSQGSIDSPSSRSATKSESFNTSASGTDGESDGGWLEWVTMEVFGYLIGFKKGDRHAYK